MTTRPTFFVDRSLGRRIVPKTLRDAGWLIEIHDEVFDGRAQSVSDEEWLERAGAEGWSVLMKDTRIRYRSSERQALIHAGSSYFETHRQDYYHHLQNVRETGDIDGWIHFFLGAVQEQAADAVARARALIEVREELRSQAVSRTRSSLPRLADTIVRNPYVTVRSVEGATCLTNQGARHLIRAAVELGWLVSLGSYGRGGREHWLPPRVLEILEASMAYEPNAGVRP